MLMKKGLMVIRSSLPKGNLKKIVFSDWYLLSGSQILIKSFATHEVIDSQWAQAIDVQLEFRGDLAIPAG